MLKAINKIKLGNESLWWLLSCVKSHEECSELKYYVHLH